MDYFEEYLSQENSTASSSYRHHGHIDEWIDEDGHSRHIDQHADVHVDQD